MIAPSPTAGQQGAPQPRVVWLALAGAVLLGLWLRAAWVSEDAHITFRAIENLLSGLGLRWNSDERVQVFSHPLWLFAVAPLYAAIGSVAWSVTLLGLACSLATLLVLGRALGAGAPALAGLCVPWLLSGCLTRYATSGFENPLTHLLLALQAAQILALRSGQPLPWARLGLVAALAGVNRLDTLALHAPVLLALAVAARGRIAWRPLAVGFAPLAAWLAFSLGYFGFFLPNTAYAKLATGVPLMAQLSNGAAYAADFVTRDFASAALLVAGWVAAATFAVRGCTDRDPRALGLAGLGLGSLAYFVSVVLGGGDFLAGRHFAAPCFASLCVFAAWFAAAAPVWLREPPALRQRHAAAVVLSIVAILGCAAGLRAAFPATVLERSAAHLALTRAGWQPTPRANHFADSGRRIAAGARDSGARVAVLPVIGIATRHIDAAIILIDPYALADPLLARLPVEKGGGFKPGHLERAIPAGYLEARDTGDLSGMHPALAEYYAHLQRVISGPLFNVDRWRTIIGFQFGEYDTLLARYRESQRDAEAIAP